MHAASQSATTVDERGGDRNLLTVHEVADLLQVRVSWYTSEPEGMGQNNFPL